MPEAWLTKVLTNLCLNQLTSARARRETYVGQWLPEPLLAGDPMLGPADTAEQRESVSYAVLVLMERLSPNERAVYVLREAFDYPHREIAEILDITEAASQQIFHRAKKHVADGKACGPRSTRRRPADRRGVPGGRHQRPDRAARAPAHRRRDRVGDGGGKVPARAKAFDGAPAGREVPAGPVQTQRRQAGAHRRLARGLRLDRQRRARRRGGGRRPGRRRHVAWRSPTRASPRSATRSTPTSSSARRAQWAATDHGEPLITGW